MKLYTKTGDKGLTTLYDMSKVGKDCIIFDALGDLDELSAQIGLLYAHTKIEFLREIQHKLLDIGSNVSTLNKKTKFINEKDVKNVEDEIDKCEEKNTPLTAFILNGVNVSDSICHICRAVCRRAERNLLKIHNNQDDVIQTENGRFIDLCTMKIDNNILCYINRISDYFFALSRNLSGCQEIIHI